MFSPHKGRFTDIHLSGGHKLQIIKKMLCVCWKCKEATVHHIRLNDDMLVYSLFPLCKRAFLCRTVSCIHFLLFKAVYSSITNSGWNTENCFLVANVASCGNDKFKLNSNKEAAPSNSEFTCRVSCRKYPA